MEQVASDLSTASLVVNKLGHVFDNFQSHAFSVLALSEQWRNLQASFTMAESSISSHTLLLESKERQLAAASKNLENLQHEVVLRQRKLESAEKSVCDRIEAVAVREKHIHECRDVMELEKGRENGIEERCRVVGVKERQIDERYQAAELEEERIVKRWIELERRGKEMDLREMNLNKVALEVELKEKKINEGLELSLKEVESRQTHMFKEIREALELREKCLNERAHELDELREKCLNEHAHVLDQTEKKVNDCFKLRCKKLGLREKRMDLKEKDLIDRAQRLELKEKELNKAFKENSKDRNEMDLREMNLNKVALEVELKEKKINVGLELSLKEVESRQAHMFKEIREGLELREKCLNERAHELDELREKCLNEHAHVLDQTEKKVNDCFKLRCKKLGLREKRMDLKEKDLIDKAQRLELKEKELNKAFKKNSKDRNEMDLKEVNEHLQSLELKEEKLNEVIAPMAKEIVAHSKVLQLKEKELIELPQALKPVEKRIKDPSEAQALQEKQLGELHCNSFKVSYLFRNMDNHGVKSFLMKHAMEELNTLRVEILNALRFAVDPPKLVLDVCRLHETNSIEYCAFRHKAIFLLGVLMDLARNITSDVKDGAINYALTWTTRLKNTQVNTQKNTQVDTCGFLLFLAVYKLASSFQANDLLELFGTLYHDDEVYRTDLHVQVCSALGILDKIPVHVGNLIGREKWLEAVRLISVFKMEHHYPPVSLLNAHAEFVMEELEKLPNTGTTIQKVKNVLQTALNYPPKFKGKSQKISTECILGHMRQLEKMRLTTESCTKHSAGHNANSQNKERNNSSGHAVSRRIKFQAELQVGLKRSLTPPECQAEKRPRL